ATPTQISQSSSTIAVSDGGEKSTETSEGTTSNLSDVSTTASSDLLTTFSTTEPSDSTSFSSMSSTSYSTTAQPMPQSTTETINMVSSITTVELSASSSPADRTILPTSSPITPTAELETTYSLALTTNFINETALSKVTATNETSRTAETTYMFPSVTAEDILKQSSTAETTSQREPMISLTSSNTVKPSTPVASTTSLISTTQLNITETQTRKWSSTTPQVTQNSTSSISSSKTNKPSATTVGTLTTVSRTASPTSSSLTTPTVTTKGTTGTTTTSARVTTKKITVASTTVCAGSRVTHIRIEGLNSKEISVSWSGDNLSPDMEYTVTLKQGFNTSDVVTHESTEKTRRFTDLLPGVTYTLTIEYFSCSNKEEIMRNITTAANIYESSTRIPSAEFQPEYKNQSSPLFQNFAAHFKEEVTKNLPSDIQDQIKNNNIRVVVTQIRRGSVIIEFDLVTNIDIRLETSTVEKNIINALNMSSLDVDLKQTTIREADACERGSHLCSVNGTCTKFGASYICNCKTGFVDQNPSFPGTLCQRRETCEAVCSSLAQCTASPSGAYGCLCYNGLIDDNPSNPGKLCRDPFDCFSEDTNLCSPSNTCLKSKSVCSRKNIFKAIVELKSWQFSPALYNPESQHWINFSTNFTINVVSKMRIVLLDKSFDLSVVGFKRGSVVVRVVFGFNGDRALDVHTLEIALQDVVRANLDKLALVTLEEVPAEENSGGGWRVAVIVIGVLLGAALLLIVVSGLAFALRRRRKAANSYQFPQTKKNGDAVPVGTFGTYSYQDV
ncbi:hypothetical protein SKAU_G00083630, partial [Synaphobranchus kaupii]